MSWRVEAAATVHGTTITIAAHDPVASFSRLHRAGDLFLGGFLAHPPRTTVASISGAAGQGFRPVGSLMVIPPGRGLEVRTRGEEQRRMIWCHIQTPGPIANEFRWPADPAALAELLDVRCPSITRLLHELADEVEAPGAGSAFRMDALLMLILVELARHLQRRMQRGGGLAPWQLRRLRDLLANSHSRPAMAVLAAECGLSERHLMRAFRQTTGMTVGDYIRSQRIAMAKTLLLETSLPLKDIAHELGYGSPASFSAALTAALGMSPRKYRAMRLGFSPPDQPCP